LTGPSANIDVTGRTGLVDQDYDQLVTVTPQFADSLPVASALFCPIGVGVGAVLFLAGEMFESIPEQIDKLWRYQYTIKGSWDDPVVEKYKDSTKSSG
ncbi:MAG TPA: AsmA-like C-terminal region-containing protein, partial [Gammaproteobacteria bacterium]|nr:AsmA-like C-terminal region-containing protein [Gammaproteobacteria bacterium]